MKGALSDILNKQKTGSNTERSLTLPDYEHYRLTSGEKLKAAGIASLMVLGAAYLCYGKLVYAVLLLPFIPYYIHKTGKKLAEKRRWELNLQFCDALGCISSALEAGYSVENALSEAYRDLKLTYEESASIMIELKMIVLKLQNSISAEEAFTDMAERSGVEDIRSFADVFTTAKRTGGNIIAIIRSTAGVIHTRVELKRSVKTAIAAKKYESDIMKVIPFAILAYLRVFSPDMIAALYSGLFGRVFMTCILAVYVALWKDELEPLGEVFEAFSYDGLCFDYSGIRADSVQESVTEVVEGNLLSLLGEGYLSFLIGDLSGVSDTKLSTVNLPSKTAGILEEEEAQDVSGMVDIDEESEENPDQLSSMADASAFATIADIAKNGLEAVYEKAVYAAYMKDSFKSYATGSESEDTMLSYEQEYILCGNTSDRANLAATAAQIMLIRTVIAGAYTFTNKEMNAKAEATALGMVGFIGLPFLVSIVKYAILFFWALEQAIVETAAILKGKKVALITSADTFCISYTELLSFSSSLVQAKAEGFTEKGVSLGYEEYLYALLLVKSEKKITMRALDMIQADIQYAYDDDFLVANCITGFNCEAKVSAGSRFAGGIGGSGEGGLSFFASRSICY